MGAGVRLLTEGEAHKFEFVHRFNPVSLGRVESTAEVATVGRANDQQLGLLGVNIHSNCLGSPR